MFQRLFIAVLLIAPLAGCLKRTETIVVMPDGTARLVTVINGDPNDVYIGDAMPTDASGWVVEDRIATKDDGKEELTRVATLTVPAGAPLPSSYAAADDPLSRIALSFDTEIRVEQRTDGTYYHVKRVYHGRPFAHVHHFHDRIMESDRMKALAEKDSDELTQAEREELVAAFITVEADKTAQFAMQAFDELGASIAPDAQLAALNRAREQYLKASVRDSVLGLMARGEGNDEDVSADLEALEQQVRHDVEDMIRVELADAGAAPRLIGSIVEQYRTARERFHVTEDLADEQWRVNIVLPGRVVAHNSWHGPDEPVASLAVLSDQYGSEPAMADLVSELNEQNATHGFTVAAFEFDGRSLFDRDVILMVSSFVPAD